MEEKGWRKLKGRLSKEYKWEVQRRNKIGRTMGGMVMGVRRGIEAVEGEETEGEKLILRVIKLEGKE